jgi:hypothetical protein
MVNRQATEVTYAKVHDQNNVDLLSQQNGYHPL